MLPLSSLGPRSASGAFAVAGGEGRDLWETDVHWVVVRTASGIRTSLTVHGYVA